MPTTSTPTRLDARLRDAGRDPASVRRYVGVARRHVAPDLVDAYRDAGADQIIMPLFATNLEDLKRRADRLVVACALQAA